MQKKSKYEGIHYWRGIWGRDKAVINNKVWKPWTPMLVKPKPDSIVIGDEITETISEILIYNVHDINETMWVTSDEFKIGMLKKMNLESKINTLIKDIELLKGEIGQ